MISVIIPSDGRDLLAKAVASVEMAGQMAGEAVEIIVVDNTPDGRIDLPGVTIIREPARNIAIVRNAGILAAQGRILVFLDDDQIFHTHALPRLIAALDETGADVAVAALWPMAHGNLLPPGSLAAAAHTRALDLPSRACIDLLGRWGKPLHRLSTGACAFKRDPLRARLFDPAFGQTGGEDTDLFCALYRAGACLVWVPEAEAREEVPPHRRDDAYQLRRLRRESASYRRIRLRYSQSKILTWIELALIGVAQSLMGIWLLRPELREKGLGKLGFGAGNFTATKDVR